MLVSREWSVWAGALVGLQTRILGGGGAGLLAVCVGAGRS